MCANMSATSNAAETAKGTAPPHGRRKAASYVCDDPLLSAREAAAETGRALSTFWRDVKRGLLPQPYRVLPRTPRWRRSELRGAVNACRTEMTTAG
jgi:predicted DNA-binding transcriptional regulator AlpA